VPQKDLDIGIISERWRFRKNILYKSCRVSSYPSWDVIGL